MLSNKSKKEYQPSILIISGGSQKGIAYIGALDLLEEKTTFSINNVSFFSGSSIGGIICTCIVIGYSIQEMKNIFLELDFIHLFEINDKKYKLLPFFYKNYSFNEGKEVLEYIKTLFIKKGLSTTITFKELFDKTNKTLIMNGSNITNGVVEYFSYKSTPNMKVIEALLITSRIPFVFPPIKYNDSLYIDGFFFDPFPIRCFDKETLKKNKGKILGINLSFKNKPNENFEQYTMSIMNGILSNYVYYMKKKYRKDIIEISNTEKYSYVKNTQKELLEMYEIGKSCADKFIS